MNSLSGTGWTRSLAFETIRYAWAATGIYFVVTSLFTKQVKRREGFAEGIPDLILFFAGFILLFWQNPLPGARSLHFFPPQQTLQVAGAVLTLLGLLLTIWSRMRLGAHFSGGVALKQEHQLVQAGPYRLVRHPIYAGLIVAAIGMVLCTATWSSLLGTILVIITFELRTRREDAFLAVEFGAEFDGYRRRTGRLLPRIFG